MGPRPPNPRERHLRAVQTILRGGEGAAGSAVNENAARLNQTTKLGRKKLAYN